MMIFSIIILASVLILLGLTIVYSKLSVLIKCVSILSTIFLVFSQIFLVYNTKGLANPVKMPPEFFALHTVIQEPTQVHKGAIYYLIAESDNNVRLYVIPYSKQSHQETQKIQDAIDQVQGAVWVSQKKRNIPENLNGRIAQQMMNEFAQGLGLHGHEDDYAVDLNNQPSHIPPKN